MLPIRELGSGPAILLLGSIWSPADYLLPLARRLEHRWRVLVPSFPGYDGSPADPRARSFDDERRLLEEALVEARATELLAVVGSSLGSYRAFGLACAGRIGVRSVVSLGGLANASAEERAALRAMGASVLAGRLPFPSLSAVAVAPAFAAAYPDVARAIDDWSTRVDWPSVAVEYDAVWQAPDLLPAVSRLEAPILARAGELDASLSPAHSEAIARAARHGTFERVAGAGHMLLLDDFEPTVRSIERFIERVESPEGAWAGGTDGAAA